MKARKARIMGKTIEIPDELVMRGVGGAAIKPDSPGNRNSPKQADPAASPLPGWPKPSDKWNYSYAQYLELEKQAGRVAYWIYEPWSMWLPGGIRYKPDFLVVYPDGLELKPKLVEVKGWSRNLRDGKTRYAIAAALFPCFDWAMVKRKGHGWEEYS